MKIARVFVPSLMIIGVFALAMPPPAQAQAQAQPTYANQAIQQHSQIEPMDVTPTFRVTVISRSVSPGRDFW